MPFRVTGPKGGVVVARATAAQVAKKLAALVARFKKVTVTTAPAAKPASKPKPKAFAMYDSVTLTAIPTSATAVAGYVAGEWPTFAQLEREFPHAKRLSIAVQADENADCLDVESGDATVAQAPAWVKRQISRGLVKPVVYCSLATVPALLAELKRAGITRSAIRLWTAHYTGKPHRCTPGCGNGMTVTADATQWTNKADGKNLDQSLCAPSFL